MVKTTTTTIAGAIIGAFLVAIVAALAIAYSTLVNTFVALKLFEWFVTPYGFAVPQFWHAAGVITLISFVFKSIPAISQTTKQTKENAAAALLSPWVTLLVGYILYCLWIANR